MKRLIFTVLFFALANLPIGYAQNQPSPSLELKSDQSSKQVRDSDSQNQPPSKLQPAIAFTGRSDRLVMAAQAFRFGTGGTRAGVSASRPFGFSHDNHHFVFAKHNVLFAVNLVTEAISERQFSVNVDDKNAPWSVDSKDVRLAYTIGFSSENHFIYVSDISGQGYSIRKMAIQINESENFFDVQSQAEIKSISRVGAFVISPNDQWLLAEIAHSPYRVYDGNLAETKLEIRNFLVNGYIRGRRLRQGAGFSCDGAYFATIGTMVKKRDPPYMDPDGDASLRIWSSKEFSEIDIYEDKKKRLRDCTAIAFSPVEQLLVVGVTPPFEAFDRDGHFQPEPVNKLVLIDPVSKLEKHRTELAYQAPPGNNIKFGRARFLTFDHTGKLIVAVNKLNKKEHSIATFTVDKLRLNDHLLINGRLNDVAVSPGSDHLAIATADGIVKILKISDLTEVVSFEHPKCGLLLFSPHGTQLACHDENGMIVLYNVKKLVEALGTD